MSCRNVGREILLLLERAELDVLSVFGLCVKLNELAAGYSF